ncbi:MAG: glycoside hydrolase family 78 protein [Bacteroidales bacterium]|jgi:alpha-L-rhamnosidase|nr:glycoside hydrolase family 78 protein [Bacteroidales bacterium]
MNYIKQVKLSFCLGVVAVSAAGQGFPDRLQCEHLNSPLGIDNPSPRLSWIMNDSRPGAVQKAYRILVGTDSADVARGKADMWDGRKTVSDKMLSSYLGSLLMPFSKYYWSVHIWDQYDRETASEVASFETGLMEPGQWQGAWISDRHDVHYKPAPYFRKTFTVKRKIKSARAYIAAGGLYELYLNGEKVGDHRLDPAFTRFDRRNIYVAHDVTRYLQQGDNAAGVLLGNGWYNHQSVATWNFDRAPWRARPAFCLDLRITYDDGETEVVGTGADWKTSGGSLVFNSIYTGEHYDARLEQHGWNTPLFDDAKWENATLRAAPSMNIVSQQLYPIRNVEKIQPVTFAKLNDTTYLYDFGKNIAGVTEFRMEGKAGTRIRIKHAEKTDANGFADQSNINVYYYPPDETDPFQTDVYILSGKGEDVFMPKFNYKGFRYVELTSPIAPKHGQLVAFFMYSDVPAVGSLQSSHPLIGKIWQATNNSYLSNLMGYPTDCPQREKNGWTGDGHLAIETALYNFDALTVYEKWLADHRDEQQPNGVLPDIIPTGGWGYGTHNGVDWTSTIAIIPWELYLFYGDDKPLEDCYENIKRYVDYIKRRSPDGLTSWARGDWVPVKSKSSLELTSSCYYYADALILAKTAGIFEIQEDHDQYMALAQKIKDAINNKYLNRETGIYASGTQTELAVPLMWGVVPEELKEKVAQNLAKAVKNENFHPDVGVLGCKALLNALSENGQAETAYLLATQNTFPSWGWWIENNATTLYENWDINATHDISLNHIMFGEIGAWFYKGLAGIYPDETAPGFANIQLKPQFVNNLQDFSATFRSVRGIIESKWQREKDRIRYTIVIPANATADLYLPPHLRVVNATVNNEPVRLKKIADANEYPLQAGNYVMELAAN